MIDGVGVLLQTSEVPVRFRREFLRLVIALALLGLGWPVLAVESRIWDTSPCPIDQNAEIWIEGLHAGLNFYAGDPAFERSPGEFRKLVQQWCNYDPFHLSAYSAGMEAWIELRDLQPIRERLARIQHALTLGSPDALPTDQTHSPRCAPSTDFRRWASGFASAVHSGRKFSEPIFARLGYSPKTLGERLRTACQEKEDQSLVEALSSFFIPQLEGARRSGGRVLEEDASRWVGRLLQRRTVLKAVAESGTFTEREAESLGSYGLLLRMESLDPDIRALAQKEIEKQLAHLMGAELPSDVFGNYDTVREIGLLEYLIRPPSRSAPYLRRNREKIIAPYLTGERLLQKLSAFVYAHPSVRECESRARAWFPMAKVADQQIRDLRKREKLDPADVDAVAMGLGKEIDGKKKAEGLAASTTKLYCMPWGADRRITVGVSFLMEESGSIHDFSRNLPAYLQVSENSLVLGLNAPIRILVDWSEILSVPELALWGNHRKKYRKDLPPLQSFPLRFLGVHCQIDNESCRARFDADPESLKAKLLQELGDVFQVTTAEADIDSWISDRGEIKR